MEHFTGLRAPTDVDDPVHDLSRRAAGPITTQAALTTSSSDPDCTGDLFGSASTGWMTAGVSLRGLGRRANEDAIFTGDYLIAVADGMGGSIGGQEAAHIALTTVLDLCDPPQATTPTSLVAAIAEAHRRVQETGAQQERRGMGTTLTMAIFDPEAERVLVANVGDSRAYLIRGEAAIALTADHRAAWIDEHGTTRIGLTRCIGGRGNTAIADVVEVGVTDGDRILVCTDGLHSTLSPAQSLIAMGQTVARSDACFDLAAQAQRNGSADDVSVVVAEVRRTVDRRPIEQQLTEQQLNAVAAHTTRKSHHAKDHQ